MKNLPSAKDISPTGGLDLDEKLALKNFHGKNVKEASDMVFENAFYYQDNFMCMGKKAFAFYFPIYCDYLKSEKSSQDANTVNAILGIIDIRLNFDASSIKIIKFKILEMLEYIINNYSKFDIDENIFSNLKCDLENIIKRVIAC